MAPWRIVVSVVVAVILATGTALYLAPKLSLTPTPTPNEEGTPPTSTTTLNIENLRYPATLPLTYLHTVDWPPQVQIVDEPFTCTEAGSEAARAGGTRTASLHGRTYCITTVAEGTAGSVYRQYAYAWAQDNKTAILTFSLQYPQCGNYPPTEQVTCQNEQEQFVVDTLIGDAVSIAGELNDEIEEGTQHYLFACPNGNLFTITYSGDDNQNATLIFDGATQVLKRALSGSGARYTSANEETVFWEHAGTARIEVQGTVHVEACVPPPKHRSRN